MNKELLRKYAQLIVKTGANIKEGQCVVIRTNVALEDFAALVSEECYKAGAKRVFVHWQSAKMDKVDYNYAQLDNLCWVPSFEEECHKFMRDELPVLMWLDGDDPDGLKGVDATIVSRVKTEKFKVVGKYREERGNKAQWVIAGYPTKEWAKKVFPELNEDQAMNRLLEAILLTARAADGNGIENWKEHEIQLKKRCAYLNSLHLSSLRYKSKTGTDFTVGLIPGVIFQAGGEKTEDGTFFQPNIPSEECFTTPMKGVAEGVVVASKPLVYQGQVIENFSIRFHQGKAVEVHAEKGEDVLKSILTLDEGASYLGEVALVPFDSPINNTGLLFFNTLYDENAACHLALGRGFEELYPDYQKYTLDELQDKGINSSLSHVDFMIGDSYLNIVGIKDNGDEVQIFKDGNWAF